MLKQLVKLIQSNRLQEAKSICEKLSSQQKNNVELLSMLADIYQRLGAIKKAEKTYISLIKLRPDNILSITNLAMLYHGQGHFSKALPFYRQSLSLDTNQATVHYNIASIYQELGQQNDAVKSLQQAIVLKSDYVKAYVNLGFIFRQQGLIEKAIECYQNAMVFAPAMAEIHYNLGLALLDAGDANAAEQHQLKAINLRPNYADAWSGLGDIAFSHVQLCRAGEHYQKALSLQANSVDILCAYSKLLVAQGKYKLAMEYVDRAVSLESDNLLVTLTQASLLSSMGRLDEALALCKKMLINHADYDDALTLAASIEEKRGNLEQAYSYLKPLLLQNNSARAVINFASISKSLGQQEQAIEKLERLSLNSEKLTASLRRKVYFTLGKAYDSVGGYDKAFNNYRAGNELRRCNFDISSMQNDIDALINAFPIDFQQQISSSGNLSTRPIFIIGMPRSGTSLMEQIISSHPQVSAAGELSDINRLTLSLSEQYDKKSYIDCIAEAGEKQLNTLAENYLACLSLINNESAHVTDKMPTNFMHLGFIQLLFPNARIIHCMRDPLDTCLSCYFQDFAQPTPWVYDLEDVGHVHLEYQRMMQHWKSVLDISMLEIQYEDLVSNQENISRKIIDFCGIDWNDNCLDFHKNKRFVKTASYSQVRKPMYKKSVSRWKNYEANIQPLKAALGIG